MTFLIVKGLTCATGKGQYDELGRGDSSSPQTLDLARLEARISILNFLVAATKQLFLISSKPLFEEL